MPINGNPNKTAKYWLPSDADDPIETRPVFLVRFMTLEEHQRHRELMDAAVNEPDNEKAYLLMMQAIELGVVGWRNMLFPPIPPGHPETGKPMSWSRENFLIAVPTDNEKWTLAWTYPAAVRLTGDDLKNFLLASPCAAAAPAASAAKPVAA